jgi:hypothetical protein
MRDAERGNNERSLGVRVGLLIGPRWVVVEMTLPCYQWLFPEKVAEPD